MCQLNAKSGAKFASVNDPLNFSALFKRERKHLMKLMKLKR